METARPLNILYVHANFGTDNGSWSTRAYDFAREWIKHGHRVSVVTGVYDRSDLRPKGLTWHGTIDEISVHAWNLPFSNEDGFIRRVATTLSFTGFACLYAACGTYDVVLASCGASSIALAGLAGRCRKHRGVVIEVRDFSSAAVEQLGIVRNRGILGTVRACESLCYRNADTVVALSDTMADQMTAQCGLRNMAVVPNTANTELFGQAEAPPQALAEHGAHMIYAGTMGRANDCRKIVQAARQLKEWGRSDIHVHLIGSGAERDMLAAESARGGLKHIHFVAPMPKKALGAWLRNATAAIVVMQPIPAHDGVSPNKLFDALAAGTPVIQTTQGWIRQLLTEHDCGITTDPDRPTAMAEAMVRLSDDRACRNRMGHNARRVATELFATELLAKRMLGILTRAAAAHRPTEVVRHDPNGAPAAPDGP